jgi:hypothetical protein
MLINLLQAAQAFLQQQESVSEAAGNTIYKRE